MTRTARPNLTLAPAVRWEPCPGFHDDPASDAGVCAGCGWPPDDHEPAIAAQAA
jgi:hypothetical protein